MAAKGKTPRIKARRSIAELEAELLKRTAERDEALAQQTATAQVLQVINSSPGDLAPVFEALLDKALTLCGGTFGIIKIYDGNSFHLGAMRGVPLEIAELMKQPIRPPFTGMVALERIVAGEPAVEIGDPRDLAGYRAGAPTIEAMVDRGGVRTGLWVALRKEDELLGIIWVYRQEIRPFTDQQIALLQNFASQAVIAIENARLLTETREALEQQTATAEVLGVINSSPGDLAPVFDAMLDKAIRLCDAAFGIMQTYDGEAFRTVALRGAPPALVEVFRERELFKPTPGTVAERIVAGETVIRATDLREEPHYLAGARPARALVELGAARSFVCIALRKDSALLGALTTYRTEIRPFTDKQIALLQNFASQAVIAMENARLITETREALEQQTATAEVLGSSIRRPATSRRFSRRYWKRQRSCVKHPLAFSEPGTASVSMSPPYKATRSLPNGLAVMVHLRPPILPLRLDGLSAVRRLSGLRMRRKRRLSVFPLDLEHWWKQAGCGAV